MLRFILLLCLLCLLFDRDCLTYAEASLGLDLLTAIDQTGQSMPKLQVMNETVRITDLWQCPASLGGDAVPSLWPGSFRRKCHR